MRLASTVPAAGSVVALLLTEDFTAKMALTDKWTIMMVGILAVNVVLAFLSKKKKEEAEGEEDQAQA